MNVRLIFYEVLFILIFSCIYCNKTENNQKSNSAKYQTKNSFNYVSPTKILEENGERILDKLRKNSDFIVYDKKYLIVPIITDCNGDIYYEIYHRQLAHKTPHIFITNSIKTELEELTLFENKQMSLSEKVNLFYHKFDCNNDSTSFGIFTRLFWSYYIQNDVEVYLDKLSNSTYLLRTEIGDTILVTKNLKNWNVKKYVKSEVPLL
jgi:hypothetical protein